MKRSGFTMIELIFVIVILGILAAVALPKFIGVSQQAQVGKLKGLVGTFNRTIAPSVWNKAMAANSGDISALADTVTSYIDMPTGVTLTKDDFTSCAGTTAATAGTIATTNTTDFDQAYTIRCTTGTATVAPTFHLFDSSGSEILLK